MAELELDVELVDLKAFPEVGRLVEEEGRRTEKLGELSDRRLRESHEALDATWVRVSPRLLEIVQAKHGVDLDALGKEAAAIVTDEDPDQRSKRIEQLGSHWTATLESALTDQLDSLAAKTLLTPRIDLDATVRSSSQEDVGSLPLLIASLWLLPSPPAACERQNLVAPFPLSSMEPAALTSASRAEGRIAVNLGASFGGAPRGRATLGHPFRVRPEDEQITVEAQIAMPSQSTMASGLGPAQAYLGLKLVVSDGLSEVAAHERKLMEFVSVIGFNEVRQQPGPDQRLICHFSRRADDTQTYLATVTLIGEATVVGFGGAYVSAEAQITTISIDSCRP